MSMVEPDRPFRLRPRAPKRVGDDSRVWPAGLRRLLYLARTTCKRSRRSPARKNSVPRSSTKSFAQRCAVRVTYSPNRMRSQWAAHGRYVLRDSATEQTGQSGRGFDAQSDQVDVPGRAAEWQSAQDPRMFKLILSPEFGERVDLKDLTRRLMQRVQGDVGAELEWAAVAHFNTEHPHVHVLLRGVAGGQEIRLTPEYVKVGIRKHAEDLCTAQLGYRTEADRTEALRREVDKPRFTSLDFQLRRQNTSENASLVRSDQFVATITEADSLLARRLLVLQSMGLAEQINPQHWHVRTDFESILRSMKKTADRQKMLASCTTLVSDSRLPMQMTPVLRITTLEGRVLGHILDDTSGRTHMVLEGTDARIHFVPHDPALESARQNRLLRPNHFVELLHDSRKAGSLAIRDLGNAEDYLASEQLAEKARRLVRRGIAPLETDWSGWLGRYERAIYSTGSSISKTITGRRTFTPIEPARGG